MGLLYDNDELIASGWSMQVISVVIWLGNIDELGKRLLQVGKREFFEDSGERVVAGRC